MMVLVLGSINMDLTTYVPRLPTPGETLLGSSYLTVPGGKGFNQAVAAGRLGAKTCFFGRTGDDGLGKQVLAITADEPVDMTGVIVDGEADTGLAVINVNEAGENVIIVIAGANMRHDDDDVARCVEAMDHADVLLLQLETPLERSLSAARAAREHGLIVVLDPAPAHKLPDDAFELATIMTPNEAETEMLVGFRPNNGVVYVTDDKSEFVSPFSVDTIDTVAAGDSFNGGLAVALSGGMLLLDALRFASAAGALATTKHGATSAMPYRAELDSFLQSQP